ncbi:hypothetical protein H5407_09180 [Mitsuaria sp. WAJ17]|uniref:hypothetical protein n=1 Tax=Mitsuaria sp. WAJ17 TaxID=2761452 RepID=UPI0016025010|nr:hypothetical protein [Mitsuaria sp. WAJ17]MBB2485398.1 hypothetical protein [Mitsuaria sp. WAJ17]
MSSPLNAAVPAAFQNGIANLIAADGTQAKVLVDALAAAAAGVTSPLLFGGGSVIDITATSTDAAAKDVILWLGQVLTTTGAATGTAAMTVSTITRSTGDFFLDGWRPGDLVMVFAAGNAGRQANDGVLGIVTGVSSATLTVNGTPFSALTLNTGVRLCRMAYQFRAPMAASAGTNGTSASVNLLNNGNDGSVLRYEKKLGLNELLAVSAASAVSALPAYINVSADVARY